MRRLNKRQIIGVLISILLLFTIEGMSARNGKIAFMSDRDGNREIYTMDADGGNQTRLTNNTLVDDHPTWSPDGRKIAFVSEKPNGGYAIYQMNADGTGKTDITSIDFTPSPYYGSGVTITWSPDGRQLAFTDGWGNPAVKIVSVDGSNLRILTSGYGPSWSPDGTKILFMDGFLPSGLFTIKPDGTGATQLPSLPSFYTWHYDASWSPAGDKIAITAFDGANEVIFLANGDGTDASEFFYQCMARTTSAEGCSRLAAPSWSPDGTTLVYFSWGVQSGRQINTVEVGTGLSRQLTTNAIGNNSNPTWQRIDLGTVSGKVVTPDGRSLRNATVALTDSNGARQMATTGSFGLFTFESVALGHSYTVTVSSKRYRFAPRTIQVDENISNVELVGQE